MRTVWAVIGAEGLKGTFKTMRDAQAAATDANGGDTFTIIQKEKGFRHIRFDHTEREYIIQNVTEAAAQAFLKKEQNGVADFSAEKEVTEVKEAVDVETDGAALADTLTEETATEESAAEETIEACDNGFRINASAVLNTFTVTPDEDRQIISEQLDDAPLFCNLSSYDLYTKRAPIMYQLTNGAEVLEAKAVLYSDYLTRFRRAMSEALDNFYCTMTFHDWRKFVRFWDNDSILRKGIIENRIAPEVMEEFGIRSPKFSKHLIKTFGEKHEIVKLFNDRPKADMIEKIEREELPQYKVVVSQLAANVMKMTAGNDFSSCQDYTTSDPEDLEYLQKLPSSVNDETISIAYLVEADESYEHPRMLARVLLSPHEYYGQLFFIGWNIYGKETNAAILKASLRNLYGERILFADELYYTDDMHEWDYEYDYDLVVRFDYTEFCMECDGDGQIVVRNIHTDNEFTVDCPVCDGDGERYSERFGQSPYVNNGGFISYLYGGIKVTRVDRKVLNSILKEEQQKKTQTA
jgi:hypothetical protein